jgi:hypothetical protein
MFRHGLETHRSHIYQDQRWRGESPQLQWKLLIERLAEAYATHLKSINSEEGDFALEPI